MTPPKRITLESFIRKYGEANQTEYAVLKAAVSKLREDSEGYRLAKSAFEKWQEFDEYLTAAGFEY